MVRRSQLLLGLVTVLVAGGIVAAYTGNAEPFVSPASLPGSPIHGVAAAGAVVLLAAVGSSYRTRRAWIRTGEAVGLTPGDAPELGEPSQSSSQLVSRPDLVGRVGGRTVRARTYSTSGSDSDSSRTYTVVEAALDPPVEWTAMFGPAEGDLADDTTVGSMRTAAVDGEVAVFGDVPEDLAADLLTPRVRDALRPVGGRAAVGDVERRMAGAMADTLSEADGAMAGLAKGMLDMAAGDAGDSLSRQVQHRDRGLCLNEAELERRVEAVVALAAAVDRHGGEYQVS